MDSSLFSLDYSDLQKLYSFLSQEEKNARLLKAAQTGQSDLVGILIASGANLKARTKDNDRLTPFLCAVQTGHNECISILLQHNPGSFYDLDGNGDNALTIALWYGRKKTFNFLLNLPGQYISSEMLSAALFAAAINDHPEEAQMLMKKGADINKIHAKDGTTPIMAAVTFESLEMVQLLLRNNVDLSLKNKLGQNVFDLVKNCNNPAIQDLFSKNIKIACFAPTLTAKIYPILPSCPKFVPPCYQPIISQEINNEERNTEDSLCHNFETFSLGQDTDLTPSAPPLSDLFSEGEPKKRSKRKAPHALDESNRKIKKNRILCASDLLSEFCFDEVAAEKVLRKGIAELSLYDKDVAVAVLPLPPVIFIAEQKRGAKRTADNYLTGDNEKVKKPKL